MAIFDIYATSKIGPTLNQNFSSAPYGPTGLPLLHALNFGQFPVKYPALFILRTTSSMNIVQTSPDVTVSALTPRDVSLLLTPGVYWPVVVDGYDSSLIICMSPTGGAAAQLFVTLCSQIGPTSSPVGGSFGQTQVA